jgi:hypothetical protein
MSFTSRLGANKIIKDNEKEDVGEVLDPKFFHN